MLVRRARLYYTVVKGMPRAALWPVAVAVLARLAVWAMIPGDRFASDEQGYVEAGLSLAMRGEQDLFWPPLTGWIVALIKTIAPAAPLTALRLVWIAMDIVNVGLVAILAGRVARAVMPDAERTLVVASSLAYALYLPAISHAQFVTSEMPALLLVLASLVLVTSSGTRPATDAAAGVVFGALLLARANLLPLMVLVPMTAFAGQPRAVWLRRTATIVVIGAAVVSAAVVRNWIAFGDPTLSRNAAYNLYIGNSEMYAEDLNLFAPAATAEQIEFRRQFAAGTLQYPTGTAAELQRRALRSIADHPLIFVRRALGRLARVFAPKTDVLELAGGEAAVGVFSPAGLTLLGIANLQWVCTLFGGVLGLSLLWQRDRVLGGTFIATIAGSVLLCLIAISKPRYSFVFDPLLIIGAMVIVSVPAGERIAAWRRARRALIPIIGFLVWGWTAWLIFAFSSRLAR